jgi:predicted metal-dependent hydrolase
MRMTVYPPDGRVCIVAPLGTDPELIRNFAAAKLSWIQKHRERFRVRSRISESFKNHGVVYIWGKAHALKIIEKKGNAKITVENGQMMMYVRPGLTSEERQQILDRWYRRRLRETAPEIIAKWASRLGVKPPGLFIRKMKTHWGSCSYTRGTIRLNSQLVTKDPLCLEYVIVHELIHFKEPSHNRNFYRLLGQAIPDWKEIRKKMNSGEL